MVAGSETEDMRVLVSLNRRVVTTHQTPSSGQQLTELDPLESLPCTAPIKCELEFTLDWTTKDTEPDPEFPLFDVDVEHAQGRSDTGRVTIAACMHKRENST
eukprot:scaffold1984_cov162-Amphora_coffeaeformis.AAC.5